MLHLQRYRADGITRTGVTQPWNIQKHNPVSMAQKVLQVFTAPYGYPGPALTQRQPAAASTMVPGSTANAVAGAQLSMPSAGAGQAGTYVTRDPYGNAVVRETGAKGLAPGDAFKRGVVATTVMHAPMHKVYAAMVEQRRAFATGSIWQQTRAEQDVARLYAHRLPFTRGL